MLTSQFGENGEIVDLLERISPDQMVIGITNNPESALGRRTNICLEMHVEPELAVSTHTYLASLILFDMLPAALLGEDFKAALEACQQVEDALEVFLKGHEQLQNEMADFLGHPATLCYFGRGHAISTAECGALFTRETAKYPALAFDSELVQVVRHPHVDKRRSTLIQVRFPRCLPTTWPSIAAMSPAYSPSPARLRLRSDLRHQKRLIRKGSSVFCA